MKRKGETVEDRREVEAARRGTKGATEGQVMTTTTPLAAAADLQPAGQNPQSVVVDHLPAAADSLPAVATTLPAAANPTPAAAKRRAAAADLTPTVADPGPVVEIPLSAVADLLPSRWTSPRRRRPL